MREFSKKLASRMIISSNRRFLLVLKASEMPISFVKRNAARHSLVFCPSLPLFTRKYYTRRFLNSEHSGYLKPDADCFAGCSIRRSHDDQLEGFVAAIAE